MKKGLIIFTTSLLLLFGTTGCTSEEPTSKDNNNNNNSEKQESKKEFTMDETVIFEKVEYTVTNVEHSQGSEWDKPNDGKEYVIVHLKIENKSDKKVSYNAYDWKMQNSQGQEDDEAFTTINSSTSLNSGDLLSGGVKEGTIVFEQPIGDTELKLNYYANMFDDNYSFQISLK